MSLSELWKVSRSQLEDKHIQQIIAFAGVGKLTDNSATSAELRDFLSHVPAQFLERYIDDCLTDSFPDSGLALQDVVNQIGRRLGFTVTDGRYRGKAGLTGFDGLWVFPDGHAVVIEVKTTDAYRIDLDRIAAYRRSLISRSEIQEDRSSILIVVGRQQTGDLEAQIRGSRHAWDVRIISTTALVRLMHLKEAADNPHIVQRICAILIPREFTRVDDIVELVFFTAADIQQEDVVSAPNEVSEGLAEAGGAAPVSFHAACVERIEKRLGQTLVKRSRSGYTTPSGDLAVVCSVSKAYQRSGHMRYWFAFHTHQRDFLERAAEGYVAFGCGSEDQLIVIPAKEFIPWLDTLNTTERSGGVYWHAHIIKHSNTYALDRKKGLDKLVLQSYLY